MNNDQGDGHPIESVDAPQPLTRPHSLQQLVSPESSEQQPKQNSKKPSIFKVIGAVILVLIAAYYVVFGIVPAIGTMVAVVGIVNRHHADEAKGEELIQDEKIIEQIATSTEEYLRKTYNTDFDLTLFDSSFTNPVFSEAYLTWAFIAYPASDNENNLFTVIYAQRELEDEQDVIFKEDVLFSEVPTLYQHKTEFKEKISKLFEGDKLDFELNTKPEDITTMVDNKGLAGIKIWSNYRSVSILVPHQFANVEDGKLDSIYTAYLATLGKDYATVHIKFSDKKESVAIVGEKYRDEARLYCSDSIYSRGEIKLEWKNPTTFSTALKQLLNSNTCDNYQ